jgi:hypothetical protein
MTNPHEAVIATYERLRKAGVSAEAMKAAIERERVRQVFHNNITNTKENN